MNIVIFSQQKFTFAQELILVKYCYASGKVVTLTHCENHNWAIFRAKTKTHVAFDYRFLH